MLDSSKGAVLVGVGRIRIRRRETQRTERFPTLSSLLRPLWLNMNAEGLRTRWRFGITNSDSERFSRRLRTLGNFESGERSGHLRRNSLAVGCPGHGAGTREQCFSVG